MSETSRWIPAQRIRFAVMIALTMTMIGMVGSVWSPLVLLLLIPGLGAGWAAFVMMRIRSQLSPRGGGWERRIHDFVVSRLALTPDSRASLLDVGCGDASLLATILTQSPSVASTGVDLWGPNWDYAQKACEARLAKLGLRAMFRRMNAARLEFPDDSFDVVVSVMCFHEVRALRDAKMRGPLVAVHEALRVLRPGGAFAFIDRFADEGDYGKPTELASVLRSVTAVRRESLVATLGVPWPLKTARALGPVEMISGKKISQ